MEEAKLELYCDTPIYEMMIAHWHGENPEEIKEQYGWWPLIKKLNKEFEWMRKMDAEDLAIKYGCVPENDCWVECTQAAQNAIDHMVKDKDVNDQEGIVSDVRPSDG